MEFIPKNLISNIFFWILKMTVKSCPFNNWVNLNSSLQPVLLRMLIVGQWFPEKYFDVDIVVDVGVVNVVDVGDSDDDASKVISSGDKNY